MRVKSVLSLGSIQGCGPRPRAEEASKRLATRVVKPDARDIWLRGCPHVKTPAHLHVPGLLVQCPGPLGLRHFLCPFAGIISHPQPAYVPHCILKSDSLMLTFRITIARCSFRPENYLPAQIGLKPDFMHQRANLDGLSSRRLYLHKYLHLLELAAPVAGTLSAFCWLEQWFVTSLFKPRFASIQSTFVRHGNGFTWRFIQSAGCVLTDVSA